MVDSLLELLPLRLPLPQTSSNLLLFIVEGWSEALLKELIDEWGLDPADPKEGGDHFRFRLVKQGGLKNEGV